MEPVNDIIRKAKKELKCALCGLEIREGGEYYRQQKYHNGNFFDTYLHAHCNEIANEFSNENEYRSYSSKEIKEWLRERYCENCIKEKMCWREDKDVFACGYILSYFNRKKKKVVVNDYQNLALQSARQINATETALEVCEKSNKVFNVVKKYNEYHETDKNIIIKELGSIFQLIAILSASLGISLEDVVTYSIEKIKCN